MPYQTDERLKSYLDTNQLHREQMCRAVLATDKRFSDVRPRHPRGGPDGGRDIQAIYRDEQTAFGAVGFVNQANDSEDQKKSIRKKFSDDLDSAIAADQMIKVFVFFTNINLTIGEKDTLIEKARKKGIQSCDIFDRERLRIVLDSPDGFSIRFQYLDIALSEEEQASFFSRWGDDIQSVISSGFQKVESALNRILFLQEANDPISYFIFSFELNRKYTSEEINHFRLFCYLVLKEPKHNLISIFFGSSDKSDRFRDETSNNFTNQKPGIKHGIATVQFEQYLYLDAPGHQIENNEKKKWIKIGSGSSIGKDEFEFLQIKYTKDSLIRLNPVICLRDLDDAMFLLATNKSLAGKIKAIHVFSNGYKLQEINLSNIKIDKDKFDFNFPVDFDKNELEDQWVRIRPIKSSTFHLRFFEFTPTRLFKPSQVQNRQKEK